MSNCDIGIEHASDQMNMDGFDLVACVFPCTQLKIEKQKNIKFLNMKTKKNSNTIVAVCLGLACLATHLAAQITPLPDHFTDWTGKVDSNFFNPGNWSTGRVPDGVDVAIRLPGDPSIPNKKIVANYTGTGDKLLQFFSIQSGASKVYTVEFSGNENGWLVLNPVGKGFTFNGVIGNSMGLSQDITYYDSTGNDTNRLASYYILNSYTRLTLNGSNRLLRQAESALSSGIFTLKGNAEMDLSQAGNLDFITSTGTYSPRRDTLVQIGGLNTDPGTMVYVGDKYVNINSRISTGEKSVMAGVFAGNPTGNPTCDVNGAYTQMTGVVNFMGDGRGTFRIRGGQYIVDGIHNGNITVWSGAVAGGSGIINGTITVEEGGLFTPGDRGGAPDNPLTVNASNFTVSGNMGFDMLTEDVYDRLTINLTGTMTINAPGNPETPEGKANLVVGMADAFPRKAGTYELMSVNMLTTTSGTVTNRGAFVGDFGSNVSLPLSMSLKPSWEWVIVTEWDETLQQSVETKRSLLISFEQMPFASPAGLEGKYLTVARRVDDIYNNAHPDAQAAYEPLFDALNRQPSITLYRELLDQLTPSTYQSWFPAAIVRANSLIQSLEDRMYQDAAFKPKKGTFQMYLDGQRQESSRAKNDEAAYSNYGTIGTVLGASYVLRENFSIGGFIGYDKTEFDLDTVGGSCDVNGYTFGLNGRLNKGNFQFNMSGFYGIDDYKSSRSVALTRLGTWADADTNGTRLGTAASIAYTMGFSWFEVTPVAGVQVMNWRADAFQERNANEASLYVYRQNEMSIQGKLGARIARSFKIKHGIIRPFFHYSLLHEFDDDARAIKADVFGERVSINAPVSNSNGYRLDVGLDWNASRKFRVELRYHSEYRGASDESVGIRGGVNYTF